MPTGRPDLPGTAAEAAALLAREPDALPLIGADATTARVLAALEDATCVTRDLRAEHPGRPDLWAALIHSGP